MLPKFRSFVRLIIRSFVRSFIVPIHRSSFVHSSYSSFIVHRSFIRTIHYHYSPLLFIVTIHRYYSSSLLFIVRPITPQISTTHPSCCLVHLRPVRPIFSHMNSSDCDFPSSRELLIWSPIPGFSKLSMLNFEIPSNQASKLRFQ
jgi:hypothetical protein